MTTNHLLPNSAATLEKRAAECLRQAVENPILIADLINPDRCPERLLPYLAWTISVDKWDEMWSEEVKRSVIRQSFFVHKQKGTLAALTRVIAPIGYLVELKEWWQETPQGTAGTFKLTVEVPQVGLSRQAGEELSRLIDDVKPVSRHYTLAISITPTGDMRAFGTTQTGEIISVYP